MLRYKLRLVQKLLGAGLVVVIMAASGCGTEAADPQGEPVFAAGDAADSSSVLVLPLDEYTFSPADFRLLSQAEAVLMTRCMARFGLEYEPPKPGVTGPKDFNARRYGVSDLESVRVNGYRVPPDEMVTKSPESKVAPSATEMTVLTGRGKRTLAGKEIPLGGCIGEAQRILMGSGPRVSELNLAEKLAGESYEKAMNDPRVQAVIEKWSACMAKKGFDYRSPLDPAGDPVFARDLTDDEIRTAVADVECKSATNLIGVWSAVEATYQREAIANNRDTLETLKRANEARLANASTVVKSR